MHLSSLVLAAGLIAAIPTTLSTRAPGSVDISGAYWDTHLAALAGEPGYSLRSVLAILHNTKLGQITGRTCLSSKVPKPLFSGTHIQDPDVNDHCDDGFTYVWDYVTMTLSQAIEVGNETLTLHGAADIERHCQDFGVYKGAGTNRTCTAIGRVNVQRYCKDKDCFTPDGTTEVLGET